MNYKPDGYASVSPYLIVSGANETIQFLTQAFGAAEIRRFPDESGKLMHSEVRLDDSVLLIVPPTGLQFRHSSTFTLMMWTPLTNVRLTQVPNQYKNQSKKMTMINVVA